MAQNHCRQLLSQGGDSSLRFGWHTRTR